MSNQCKTDCKDRIYTPQRRNSKKTFKTQSPQWSSASRYRYILSQYKTIHTVIKRCRLQLYPKMKERCTKMGGANAQAAYTSEQQRPVASCRALQGSIELPIWSHVFIDGSQTLSTLGVKYAKKQTGFWVSCIRIPEHRGSELEAQMTLGHFYLVHHRIILHQRH